MHSVPRRPYIAVALSALLLFVLASCGTLTATPETPNAALPQASPPGTRRAAALAASPASGNRSENQAAATAEVLRANAQANLDSANATLGAVQTQDQSSANVIAAQIASTAEIERANAQSTLVASISTRDAAFTQDAIGQTQGADLATTGAQALLEQQSRDQLAAGTQTAVSNSIATQTQVAVATSQWYADQARQRAEQRQGPIAFLWMWCLPGFVIAFAAVGLWGVWRWLKLKQDRQQMSLQPIERLKDLFRPPASKIINGRYRLTKPDDEMRGWLDEIKRKLSDAPKDDDEHTDS